jgi:LPS-assembly lipoprotein
MRGTADVPFETIHVPGATAGIALDLKRNIENGTRARVVDDPKAAQALVQFTEEARSREILSLTSAGRVREFQLRYRVGFRVHDGKGGEFVPPSVIQLTRDMTYSDAEILAKEQEEQLLFRDMQSDMVRQILRRLASAKPPAPRLE